MPEHKIKALTLWQPWASLCVWTNPDDGLAEKQIETRSWPTKYRGWMAIHAAKDESVYWDALQDSSLKQAVNRYLPQSVPPEFGAIIGLVNLIDVWSVSCTYLLPYLKVGYKWHRRNLSFGDYSAGRFGWIFNRHIQLTEPIPCKGAQGLWNLPPDVEQQLKEQYPECFVEV